VFIPSPPPSRSLELLTLIDSSPQLHSCPIFYLSKTCLKALSQTRTMLEWLSQDIPPDAPLTFPSITFTNNYTDLSGGKPGPRLVIVEDANISPETFARQTFLDFKSTGNLLLFPTRRVTHPLPRTLLSNAGTIPASITTQMTIEQVDRVAPSAEDLAQWKRNKSLEAEKLSQEVFQGYDSEEQDSDEEPDEEDAPLPDKVLQGGFDFWRGQVKRSFPFVERRVRRGEWGVEVRAEEYLHVEEESAPVVEVVVQGGGKRRWGEMVLEEVPEREVRRKMDIDVNLLVEYVDLEGLHDGRAVGNLLPRCNPRKIVLVTATELM
jgi:cleavage and polyadenylation specificity factor subunit 2